MSKKLDIRQPQPQQEQQEQPAEPNTLEWFKQNRHLFGPFKSGAVVQEAGPGKYVQVGQDEKYVPEPIKTTVPEEALKVAQPEIKISGHRDLKDLPPEKQKAIIDALNQAKNKLAAEGISVPIKQEQPTDQVNNNPGLPPEFKSGPVITDFLASVSDQDAKQEDPSTPNNTNEKLNAGAPGIPPFCPHCGWDQAKQDPEEPTELDKLNFIQSILGQIAFKKEYELFGGNVKIVFRTLFSDESDATFTQVAYDAGRGDILDENQYFRTLIDYRLCLGLNMLKTKDSITELPEYMHDWAVDVVPVKATKLVHIVPWIYANVLKAEPIRRAIAACFYRFQRLVEKMEARCDDANFWQAIEKRT